MKINGVIIRVTQGDIADETTDTLVNYTNVDLDLKGQVSQALCKKVPRYLLIIQLVTTLYF